MLGSNKIIAFVCATDSKRARAFYEGILGLRFVSDDQFALVLNGNGTMLRIAKLPELKPAQFTVLGWETGEIEKTVEELIGKGIQFEKYSFLPQDDLGIWTAPTGDKVAWFRDPDGNILSLSQHV
jgi:catechol 2,3-dioxygenase-like lactoylglutathione lyase family enzyme